MPGDTRDVKKEHENIEKNRDLGLFRVNHLMYPAELACSLSFEKKHLMYLAELACSLSFETIQKTAKWKLLV